MTWRCGVCEGVNAGGETCAICGASRATAVPVERPEPAPAPASAPEPVSAPVAWDEPVRPAPRPRRRGLLGRIADAAAGVVERALMPPLEAPESPEAPEAPRPRGRMRVRPVPFGLVVTWESDAPPDDPPEPR